MSFAYTARDMLGNQLEGAIDAASLDEARQSLRRDGLTILSIEEDEGEGLLPRRVTRSEIIYVTSQLAIMVDTGINLSAALHSIAEQEENPTLQSMLRDLKRRVESGDDFSSALSAFPKHFDCTYVSLIRASEQTGGLAEMLDRIATYLRNEAETRSKVRAAMAYPAVMLVLAVSVTVFLLTFVLPRFTPIFERKGVSLPLPTVVIMGASNVLLEYWPAWLCLAAALVGGWVYMRRSEGGRRVIDWAKLRLPVLGAVVRKVALSRCLRTLGAMVRSGVPMLDAISTTADVAGNTHYRESWLRVHGEVTKGSRIADILGSDPLFPRTLVQMIAAGEETGRLDDVLNKVSDYYDAEVETSLKTATSLIEPIMITVMGVVVGGIGLGLLLPIFSLSRGAG